MTRGARRVGCAATSRRTPPRGMKEATAAASKAVRVVFVVLVWFIPIPAGRRTSSLDAHHGRTSGRVRTKVARSKLAFLARHKCVDGGAIKEGVQPVASAAVARQLCPLVKVSQRRHGRYALVGACVGQRLGIVDGVDHNGRADKVIRPTNAARRLSKRQQVAGTEMVGPPHGRKVGARRIQRESQRQ